MAVGGTPESGVEQLKRNWVLPVVSVLLGVAVVAYAGIDYITSPPTHRGISVGPLFIPLPGGSGGPGKAGQTPGHGQPGGSPRPGGSPPPVIGANGLKLPLTGLLDRQKIPSSAFYGVINGYVVNVTWAALQPSPGGPINPGPIDQAIAQVRAANAAGGHLGLRLRVLAGISAPAWVKNLGGPPVTVTDIHSGASGTVGRWWRADYIAAYANLQAQLAARYDSVPEIRDTTIDGCMTIYAEPMIHQTDNPTSVANLWGAGYSLAADEACQRAQVQAHAAWRHTRSEFSFNPYTEILSATKTGTSEAFTAQMISYCRAVLGARCIVMNDSLRVTAMSSDYNAMYSSIAAAGPNIGFQTATMARVGNLLGTLSKAVGLGAASVELPYGYQSMSATSFGGVLVQLAANARS